MNMVLPVKLLDRIKSYGNLVMFSHTLFSLPFGIISMLWAANGIPQPRVFVYILLALMGARNGANAFNRIADRYIDMKNERTSKRPLQTGAVRVGEAWAITIICFLVMAFSAYQLNLLCLILMPFAIFICVFYSYTKRFTWLCHFVLGTACGGAPVGAWIAVTGRFDIVPLALGAAVCCWVAGFDIIYATQDIAFDRQENLHSIPARFGLTGALWIARAVHTMMVIFLLVPAVLMPQRTWIYLAGLVVVSVLLVIKHRSVALQSKGKTNTAAYFMNQVVSVVFFVFAAVDFIAGRLA